MELSPSLKAELLSHSCNSLHVMEPEGSLLAHILGLMNLSSTMASKVVPALN
jgi:hypothetical protein